MVIDFARSSHLYFFGVVIPLFGWALSRIIFMIFPNWPFWLEGFSPLAIYSILYSIFDSYLWKIEFFRKMGIVWFPNLNGRWKGIQRSSYKERGVNVEVKGALEIKQTFSSIEVKAYYQRSDSESVSANFADLNGEVYLFYSYDNDPSTLKSGTMERHKGTAKIKYLRKEYLLKGCYWNSVGNHGEMDYEFESLELLGH